ncbi:MAG: hypothetical protein ABWY05_08470 [Noviherbaspirillum sp.]
MHTATMSPDFFEPAAVSSQPDLLVSAVLHLMSHYSTRPGEGETCLKLACVIERHLKALASLPQLSPVLQGTCSQLAEQWASHIDRAAPPAGKPGLLSRVLLGADSARGGASQL